METLEKIVPKEKLITQAAYAKLKNISRQRVNQIVKAKDIKTVTIKGAVLILLD